MIHPKQRIVTKVVVKNVKMVVNCLVLINVRKEELHILKIKIPINVYVMMELLAI